MIDMGLEVCIKDMVLLGPLPVIFCEEVLCFFLMDFCEVNIIPVWVDGQKHYCFCVPWKALVNFRKGEVRPAV